MKTKTLFFFAISTCGMIVFATLYFSSPKIVVQKEVETVTNTITNEVVKEVPKEVEKIVTVPAEIPANYIRAMEVVSNFDNADIVNAHQALFGMKDVQVVCSLNEDAKQVISEGEVQSKFELALRRNNISINPKSKHTIDVMVEALRTELPRFGSDPIPEYLFTFTITVAVFDVQTLIREGQIHKTVVTVWQKSYLGCAGRKVVGTAILDDTEKEAELFANDFLSANPK